MLVMPTVLLVSAMLALSVLVCSRRSRLGS
jgi:hypothetical protein